MAQQLEIEEILECGSKDKMRNFLWAFSYMAQLLDKPLHDKKRVEHGPLQITRSKLLSLTHALQGLEKCKPISNNHELVQNQKFTINENSNKVHHDTCIAYDPLEDKCIIIGRDLSDEDKSTYIFDVSGITLAYFVSQLLEKITSDLVLYTVQNKPHGFRESAILEQCVYELTVCMGMLNEYLLNVNI
jgi:hypothetical protein